MKTRTRKIYVVIVLMIVLTISFSEVASAENEWNWAYHAALSGPYSAWGNSVLFSVNWAIDKINEKGGVNGRKVNLTTYDNAFDPAIAVTRMQTQLAKHTINIGPLWAGMVTAAMPVAKRQNAFIFVPNNNRSNMQRFKGNLFNLFTHFDKALLDTTGGWFKREPDITKLAIIFNPMDEFWIIFSEIMVDVAKKHGIETIPPIELGQGTGAAAAVTKALNAGANGFNIIAQDHEIADVLIELERRGVSDKGKIDKGNILIYFFADSPSFEQQAKGLTSGAYLWEIVNRLSKKPAWKEFSETYAKANNGNTPGIADIVYVDAALLAAKACEELNLTGSKEKRGEEWKKLTKFFANVPRFDGITATYPIVDYYAMTSSFLMQYDNNGKLRLLEEYKQ